MSRIKEGIVKFHPRSVARGRKLESASNLLARCPNVFQHSTNISKVSQHTSILGIRWWWATSSYVGSCGVFLFTILLCLHLHCMGGRSSDACEFFFFPPNKRRGHCAPCFSFFFIRWLALALLIHHETNRTNVVTPLIEWGVGPQIG